jgi:hypothetical protein
MNESGRTHLFWGAFSPLGGLSGAALLVMASARLAWALSVSGALIWVYTLSVLAAFPGGTKTGARIFPRQGKQLFFVFLAFFTGSLYLLLLWITSPIAALEVFLPVCLVPLFCAGSGVFARVEALSLGSAVSRAVSEAVVIAGLLIALAIIREPLGFYSLTLPGGMEGMIPIFSFEGESFMPIRVIAGSAGALLLLGYAAAVYRYFRSVYAPGEENQ